MRQNGTYHKEPLGLIGYRSNCRLQDMLTRGMKKILDCVGIK